MNNDFVICIKTQWLRFPYNNKEKIYIITKRIKKKKLYTLKIP